QVNIYICKTQKSPKRQNGTGCYILEFVTEKGAVTRTGFVELENETANSAEIVLVTEALRRLNEKCSLALYTEAGQVGTAVETGWIGKWEQNGWKTGKGTPVQDREKWEAMGKLLIGHDFCFKTGKHPYLEWMNREVKQREKERLECLKDSEILTVQRN
ncbi:MAG: hypothetical protein NC086_08145, partial [Alistipes sp.]|nr:hypothetical protein [Alistipes sp.]